MLRYRYRAQVDSSVQLRLLDTLGRQSQCLRGPLYRPECFREWRLLLLLYRLQRPVSCWSALLGLLLQHRGVLNVRQTPLKRFCELEIQPFREVLGTIGCVMALLGIWFYQPPGAI